jgi:hypothetical protein
VLVRMWGWLSSGVEERKGRAGESGVEERRTRAGESVELVE